MFYFMVFTSLVYVVSLEKNPLIKLSLFIFLLDVNFENLIIGLYVFIIFSILAKFQEDQRSITISIKCFNFKFL